MSTIRDIGIRIEVGLNAIKNNIMFLSDKIVDIVKSDKSEGARALAVAQACQSAFNEKMEVNNSNDAVVSALKTINYSFECAREQLEKEGNFFLLKDGFKNFLFKREPKLKEAQVEENSLGWNNPKEIRLETDVLNDAINWFKKNNIPLWGVNENPEQKNWTSSTKPYAHLYIDDSALGCPIIWDYKLSGKPFVDWDMVEADLHERGWI